MKETIYSIPINESFELVDGVCPICRLHGRLEEDGVEYVLGAAMMEPDVRLLTNAQGFCPRHLAEMASRPKRLPLALILQTHLHELNDRPQLLENAGSCYICSRVDGFMRSYYSNILHLWRTQPDFAKLFDAQKYICRPHIAGLLAAAPLDLSKKEKAAFTQALTAKAAASIKELEDSLAVFTRSFDHRFAGEELGPHRAAPQNAIDFLTGGKR